jgi:hypothetical protein
MRNAQEVIGKIAVMASRYKTIPQYFFGTSGVYAIHPGRWGRKGLAARSGHGDQAHDPKQTRAHQVDSSG